MKLAACIFIKIFQIIFTATSVIVKKIADKYSERVFTRNQKYLTEWTLLNSISWTKESDDFTTLTMIGFLFISTVLLLTRIIEKMTYYQTCEIILLSCGIVFFVVEGLLIFTTIEQLQDTISDYAYALGIISFSCAALFALDVMLFRQMMAAKNASSQTDLESVIKASNSRGVTTTMRSDRCCAFKQKHNETPLKYLRTDL